MRITILGSSSLADVMVEYRDKLTALGHQVNLHDHYVAQGNGEMSDLVERMNSEHAEVKKEYGYHKYHYDEIVNRSDAVLVLNFDKNDIRNYIGGNTLMEMGFAHVHNKKIFLLNPIPNMSYTDEIKSLDPVVLNGDLDLIR